MRSGSYPHEYLGAPADPPVEPTPAEAAEGRRIVAALRVAAADEPARLSATPWRVARSLDVLLAEANAANPRRDKTSDGAIGDAAHATRVSDHNPFVIVAGIGIVRARDLDADGLPLAEAFERGRQLAAAGHLEQVTGGGYLIYSRRITRPDWSGWNVYTGPNPHTVEGHVSVSLNPAQFDSTAPWGLFTATTGDDDMQLTELVQYRPQQFDGASRSLYDSANQALANLSKVHAAIVGEGAKDAARDAALLEALKAIGTGGVAPEKIVAAAREAAQQELADAADRIAAAVLSAQERDELARLRERVAELEGRSA